MEGTHYDVLGVAPTATAQEIDAQYRALAKIVHPDRGGDPITFMVLDEAYDVLADPAKRAAYDRSLQAGEPAQPVARRAAPGSHRDDLGVYPNGWRRLSTDADRAEAARRTRLGLYSWHQTPRQRWQALRHRLVGGLVIGAVAAIIRALVS